MKLLCRVEGRGATLKPSEQTLLAVMCLLGCCASGTLAQTEGELPVDLTATRRLLAGAGPGLRAIKRGADGRTYVLSSPAVLQNVLHFFYPDTYGVTAHTSPGP